MQTFLPYPEFQETARCLDPKRLGNQCWRETKTLITGGWPNHPASKMWQGHFGYLALYGYHLAVELRRRGYRTAGNWVRYYYGLYRDKFADETDPPYWLGATEFHLCHQSNLLRKDPEWYGQFGWEVPSTLPYIWPNRK